MKKFFATYIIDQNPNYGGRDISIKAQVVRSKNKVVLKDSFKEMFDYCKSLIDLDMQEYPEEYVRICLTKKDLSLLDIEDYQVMRYDIHEINL